MPDQSDHGPSGRPPGRRTKLAGRSRRESLHVRGGSRPPTHKARNKERSVVGTAPTTRLQARKQTTEKPPRRRYRRRSQQQRDDAEQEAYLDDIIRSLGINPDKIEERVRQRKQGREECRRLHKTPRAPSVQASQTKTTSRKNKRKGGKQCSTKRGAAMYGRDCRIEAVSAVAGKISLSQRDEAMPQQLTKRAAKDTGREHQQLLSIKEERMVQGEIAADVTTDHCKLVIEAATIYRRSVAKIRAARLVRRSIRFRGIGGIFFTRLGESPLAAWELAHQIRTSRGERGGKQDFASCVVMPSRNQATNNCIGEVADAQTRTSYSSALLQARANVIIRSEVRARQNDQREADIQRRGTRWRSTVTAWRHAVSWYQAAMILEIVRRASRWRRGTAYITRMNGLCGRYEALRRAFTRWRPSGCFRSLALRDAIVRTSTRWRMTNILVAGLLLHNAA